MPTWARGRKSGARPLQPGVVEKVPDGIETRAEVLAEFVRVPDEASVRGLDASGVQESVLLLGVPPPETALEPLGLVDDVGVEQQRFDRLERAGRDEALVDLSEAQGAHVHGEPARRLLGEDAVHMVGAPADRRDDLDVEEAIEFLVHAAHRPRSAGAEDVVQLSLILRGRQGLFPFKLPCRL